jgi:hypothetical protein
VKRADSDTCANVGGSGFGDVAGQAAYSPDDAGECSLCSAPCTIADERRDGVRER